MLSHRRRAVEKQLAESRAKLTAVEADELQVGRNDEAGRAAALEGMKWLQVTEPLFSASEEQYCAGPGTPTSRCRAALRGAACLRAGYSW